MEKKSRFIFTMGNPNPLILRNTKHSAELRQLWGGEKKLQKTMKSASIYKFKTKRYTAMQFSTANLVLPSCPWLCRKLY